MPRLYNATNNVSGLVKEREEDLSCLVGLALQCEDGEECIPRNSRSRAGMCQCIDGFVRDLDSGWCLQEEEEKKEDPKTHHKKPAASKKEEEKEDTDVDSGELKNEESIL